MTGPSDAQRRELEATFLHEQNVDRWGDLYDLARHDFNAGVDAGWAANTCPAIGPSDQECIGRGFWHEVHADSIGTTWRDYAGKAPGIPAPATRRTP